jgi:hypothetical protein
MAPQIDLPIARLRPIGGELQRHVGVGSLDDPEAGEELLRLHEGTVGEERLLTATVDDGRGAWLRQAVGVDPVAPGAEPVVERVDGGHLVRAGQFGAVGDHGNEALHLGSSPVIGGAARRRPLTLTTNSSAPIRHRLPDFFHCQSIAAISRSPIESARLAGIGAPRLHCVAVSNFVVLVRSDRAIP